MSSKPHKHTHAEVAMVNAGDVSNESLTNIPERSWILVARTITLATGDTLFGVSIFFMDSLGGVNNARTAGGIRLSADVVVPYHTVFRWDRNIPFP
eukprot:scaffold2716_cov179-Amphora_coffeaeformis.AAC.10